MGKKPEFVSTSDEVLEKYGDVLRRLIGLTLQEVWIAWWLEHDEWLVDEAVVFQFDEIQIEASFHRLSQFAITLNTVNLDSPPNWLGCWDDMDLEWRKDAHPAIDNVKGKKVRNIAIVNYLHRTTIIQDKNQPERVGEEHQTWLLNGLEFKFDDSSLILYNALDENGLTNEDEEQIELQKTWLN